MTTPRETRPTRDLVKRQEVLMGLFETTAHLFFSLRRLAERIHDQGEMSAARRGFLRGLREHGPETVARMARARPVSRQHFQRIANGLATEGLVEFVDNPNHRRSKLVSLTAAGCELLARMDRVEAAALSELEVDVANRDLAGAVRTLNAVRTAVAGGIRR